MTDVQLLLLLCLLASSVCVHVVSAGFKDNGKTLRIEEDSLEEDIALLKGLADDDCQLEKLNVTNFSLTTQYIQISVGHNPAN